jgi:type II secretory pathway component PulF
MAVAKKRAAAPGMLTFEYKARTKVGVPATGKIEAPNKDMASTMLIRKGLIPSSVQEVKKGDLFGFGSSINRFETIGLDELIMFTSQFATMFKAGLPIMQCLEGLSKEAENKKLARVLFDLKNRVQDGAALNEALQKHTDVFSETFINMVMAGEIAGTLDVSLRRLTDILEKQFETQNKIKEVTRYPKIVVGSVVIAVSVLMMFVVPKFVGIFEKTKLELPLPTKILIMVNAGFHAYWYLILASAIGGYYAFKAYTKTGVGRFRWHRFSVHAPIFGNIMLKLTLGSYCQVLSSLLKSGIPILQAIEVAGRTAGNDYLMKIFMDVRKSVHEGSGMASKMGEYDIIPGLVTQMISVGESTGALDTMLMEVSGFFMGEADRKIKNLSSLIEPIMLLVLGSIVLFIALAIFLPMWDMTKMAKH